MDRGTEVIIAFLLLSLVLMVSATPSEMIDGEEVNTTFLKDRSSRNARTAAWDEANLEKCLTFKLVKGTNGLFKRIRVQNLSNEDVTYTITPKFWNEASSNGAVNVSPVFPGKVKVGAGMERSISVAMTIRGHGLSAKHLKSLRSEGAASLSELSWTDFDGYLEIDDGAEPIHLPWHIVTHQNEHFDFTDNQSLGVATVKK